MECDWELDSELQDKIRYIFFPASELEAKEIEDNFENGGGYYP